MDEKEIARKLGEPLMVCQYPDVCLSPTAPAPYLITAPFAAAYCTADTVHATKVPSFTLASFLPAVDGDAAGSGGGMKSGTHSAAGVCWAVGASTTVRAQKSFVVRHEDPVMMNNGNVPGLVHYPKGGAPRASVGDASEPSLPSKPAALVAEAPVEGNFFTGLGQSLTETYEGVAGQAKTLWDATGITATDEATQAARTAIYNGASNVGSLVKDGALTVTVPFYETDAGLAALARMADRTDAVTQAVEDRYATALDEGGQAHATGLLFGDLGQIVFSFGAGSAIKSVRGAEALATLEKAEDVVGVASKTDKVLDVANDLRKVDEVLPGEALPGARLPKDVVPDAPLKEPLPEGLTSKTGKMDYEQRHEITASAEGPPGPDGTRVFESSSKSEIMERVEQRRAARTPGEQAQIDADRARISELSNESDALRKAGDEVGANAKLAEARAILQPSLDQGDVAGIIDRLDVSTAPGKGYLWSGGFKNLGPWADKLDVTLLETTTGGRVVNGWDLLNQRFSTPEFWGPLSDRYASQLSGDVFALGTDRTIGVGGDIFNYFERPHVELGLVSGQVTNFGFINVDQLLPAVIP
ncbi:MAG: PAAR-like domain-containing protein [Polyangiales bacterium]